jgi:hypothetical protein
MQQLHMMMPSINNACNHQLQMQGGYASVSCIWSVLIKLKHLLAIEDMRRLWTQRIGKADATAPYDDAIHQ